MSSLPRQKKTKSAPVCGWNRYTTHFFGSGTFLIGATMSVSFAAELLRYSQTRIDSVGRKVNISHASMHRFTNVSSPQRAGASCLSRPIYLPRCTFVVFNYCCCVEFWWRLFVSLHRIFPDIWFPIYCILLAKRNVQQKIPSTCQETTVEE